MRILVIGATGLLGKEMLRFNAVSPGGVAEILRAMGRDPDEGVGAAVVAQAFQKCVVEDITGQVVSAAR